MYKIGIGYDIHKMVSARELIIGGVKIPHTKGLLGHSDADVLIHAIIDAIFGAASLTDIGTHFPDNDPQYRGASSILLLEKTVEIIALNGYKINNIDSNIIAQEPKMMPYITQMRKNIAKALKIDENLVSVKAKTNEGMDAVGERTAIEANAVVLLVKD